MLGDVHVQIPRLTAVLLWEFVFSIFSSSFVACIGVCVVSVVFSLSE